MPSSRTRLSVILAVVAVAAVATGVVANQRSASVDLRTKAEALTGGDAERGRAAFIAKGCGGCHALKGVAQASGQVGPPLDGIARRAIVAGMLENTPDNLTRWIKRPQSVVPGNAMPDLPMTDHDARDIAAFLYAES
jgi:cytochrome c2